MRVLAVILGAVYMCVLAGVSGGDFLYAKAMASNDLKMLKNAQKLDPWSSKFFYGEYRLTGGTKALERAIRLEPAKAAYHAYYGLALLKDPSLSGQNRAQALRQICLGAQLKPYSPVYRRACETFGASCKL